MFVGFLVIDFLSLFDFLETAGLLDFDSFEAGFLDGDFLGADFLTGFVFFDYTG